MFLPLAYLYSGLVGHSDLEKGGCGIYWEIVPGETQYQDWSWIQEPHVRGQQTGKGFGMGWGSSHITEVT